MLPVRTLNYCENEVITCSDNKDRKDKNSIVYGHEIQEIKQIVVADNQDTDEFDLLRSSSKLHIKQSSNMKKLFLVGICKLAKAMKQNRIEDCSASEAYCSYFLKNLDTATRSLESFKGRYTVKYHDIGEGNNYKPIISFFCTFDNRKDPHEVFSFDIA